MDSTREEILERRRIQNRLAQRRFRRRHGHKQSEILGTYNDRPETTHSGDVPFPIVSSSLPSDGIIPLSQSMQWSAVIQSASSSDTLADQVVDEDHIFIDDLVFDETGVLDNSSLETTESQSPEREIIDMSAPVHVGNPSAVIEGISHKPGQKLRGWLGPLHIAAQKGHGAIVRILMQHNTNCDERDSDGMTALMHAIIEDHEEIALSLLSNGARISILDNRRRSTLHWAALYRRESLLRALLNHHKPEIHSSINVYDSDMRTPLHTAVYSGFDAGVELLLTFGANASLKTWKIPDGQK